VRDNIIRTFIVKADIICGIPDIEILKYLTLNDPDRPMPFYAKIRFFRRFDYIYHFALKDNIYM